MMLIYDIRVPTVLGVVSGHVEHSEDFEPPPPVLVESRQDNSQPSCLSNRTCTAVCTSLPLVDEGSTPNGPRA